MAVPDRNKAGIKLSHTAALVMLWGMEALRNRYAHAYINRLDLSEGHDLVESCNVICPWYSEVIVNRKFYIRKLLEQFNRRTDGHFQLVILAAGADPLALEALDLYGDKLDNVIEVDLAYNISKRHLYADVAPEFYGRINFLQADVRDKDMVSRMESYCGYNRSKPTFIVAEGLSYFLTKDNLAQLFARFNTEDNHNMFIMDYLLTDEHIGRDFVIQPRQVINKVMEYISESDQSFECLALGIEEVEELYQSCNCYTNCFYPQSTMEHCRKGIYAYFHPDNDGWVALASGKI